MLVRLASPPLLLVSALDPSNHSRPRRTTVPADCALPTYPVFVHAALIHTATFTRFLWDCPISLLRRKAHIRAYTPVTPRVASLSARRNDKRANIRTQMPLLASLCAHGRRCALRDANERIRARTLEIPRLTSFISSNGIPTAIHSSSTVHSQYVAAKPQHNQAPPHEKSPQHHFLGFKGLIAALADIYLHFKGLLFVNPPYIDGDIPPLILRILADSNPSKRRCRFRAEG